MKAPHRTEHVFSPREGGYTEEITVELELQPSPSESRVEDVSTLIEQNQPHLSKVDFPSPTQSQPQLAGIWASRAQFPGTPLEPRQTLISSEETVKPKRSFSAVELTDGQRQTGYSYSGNPLLGAWAKPGISGASVIKSAVQRPASPAYSSNSSSGSSTPRTTGNRTDLRGLVPQLKYSISGPVGVQPQARSPYSYHQDRRHHSEQFTRRDFQGVSDRYVQDVSRNEPHQVSPRGRNQQGNRGQRRGRGSGRRLSETPRLEGEGPRRPDGEGPWRTPRGGRFRDRGPQGQGPRKPLSPPLELDYQRSFSDTKAMKRQQQSGSGESQQSSKRPESEPPPRERGRTGRQH